MPLSNNSVNDSNSWVSERHVQVMFVIFVFVGSASIVLLGSELIWGKNIPVINYWMIGVTSVIIIVYAALGWYFWGYKSQEFADTVYFLGFVFTLIALSLSLATYGENQDSATISTIVTQNGVALITTIVGLVLRVLMTDIVKVEEAVDVDTLKKSLQTLVNELDTLSQGIKVTGSRVLYQTGQFANAMEYSSELIKTKGKNVASSMQAMVDDLRNDLGQGVKDMVRISNNEVREATKKHVEAHQILIKQTAGKLESGVELVVNKMSKIIIPSDIIASRIEPAASDAGEAMVNFANQISHAATRSLETRESWDSLSNLVSDLRVGLQEFSDYQSEINSKWSQDREKVAKQVLELSSELTKGMSLFSMQIDQNSAALSSMDMIINSTSDLAVNMKNTLHGVLPEVRDNAKSLQENVSLTLRTLEEMNSNTLAQYRLMLENIVAELPRRK